MISDAVASDLLVHPGRKICAFQAGAARSYTKVGFPQGKLLKEATNMNNFTPQNIPLCVLTL
jgi:hypothetical protein